MPTWTARDVKNLLKLHHEGKDMEEIGKVLGRSKGACSRKLTRLTNENANNDTDNDAGIDEDYHIASEEYKPKYIKPYSDHHQYKQTYIWCCKCTEIGGNHTAKCKRCKKRYFHKSCISGEQCPRCKYMDCYKDNGITPRKWNSKIDSVRLAVIQAQGITKTADIGPYFPYLAGNKAHIITAHKSILRQNHLINIKSRRREKQRDSYNTRSKANKSNEELNVKLSARRSKKLKKRKHKRKRLRRSESSDKPFSCNNNKNKNTNTNTNMNDNAEVIYISSESDNNGNAIANTNTNSNDNNSDIEILPNNDNTNNNSNNTNIVKIRKNIKRERNEEEIEDIKYPPLKKQKLNAEENKLNWRDNMNSWNTEDVLFLFSQHVEGFNEYRDQVAAKFREKKVNGKSIQKMEVQYWDQIFGIKELDLQLSIDKFVQKEKQRCNK